MSRFMSLCGAVAACQFSLALACDPSLAQTAERPGIWTGFYAGLNAGYGWGKFRDDTGGNPSRSITGAIGGGHVGYNWQSGTLVGGVEGDYDFAGLRKSFEADPVGPVNAKASVTGLGSIRARLGYAQGPALFFLTGGYGWARGRLDVNDLASGASLRFTHTNGGFVLGGGLEYKMMPNVSVRGELLHYFARGHWDDPTGGPSFRADTPVTQVRFGASWHFN